MSTVPGVPSPAPAPQRAGAGGGLWREARPWDVTFAVAAGFVTLLWIPSAGAGGYAALLGLLLSIPMCAALAWRRTRPVGSAAVFVGAAALQVLLPGLWVVPADLLLFVYVYSVAAHGPDRLRFWSLAVGGGGAVVGMLRYTVSGSLSNASVQVNADGTTSIGSLDLARFLEDVLFGSTFVLLAVLVAWGAGILRRGRIARAEALRERARFVELGREQEIRLAAQAERARIARDLHDVVAHSLAVMITQADGGRYAARTNPAAAVTSLETIAETGRTALAEMRRLLGVLRDDVAPPATATAPQPGLDDLPDLVEGLRSGGLAVTLEAQGSPVPLPQGMGVAAYRIVQEGLTNVLKHAGPEVTARVCVWWSPSALTVDVVDDGRGAGALTMPDGQGQGLLGMRERAAVYGGSVQAGPMPGGGFGVRAVFPLAAAPVRGVA